MANHAALIRSANPGRTVTARGRRFIEFDMGGGVKRRVLAVDPLHYGDGTQEIDTTWQPSIDPAWQWQLIANDFQVHARSVLNAGDVVQWLDARSGESVTLQPLALNWVDNITDSRQQITQPQAVTATANDASLTWANGYGTGRHFRYTAHPRRLIKEIIIDSPASLPAPTVSNPYLEIEFILKRSGGINLYIDGAAWDNTTKVATARAIEFRLANGTVAWTFDAPIATDANNQTVAGRMQLRRQGANRYVTVRFPKAWIDAAAYPIRLDPTFTDGYSGDTFTAYDTYLNSGSPDDAQGNSSYLYTRTTDHYVTLMKFDLSTLSGVTINSATLYVYNSAAMGASATGYVHRLLSADAGWVEGATWNYHTPSTTRWAGDTGSNGGSDAGASVSGTDYSSTQLGTWSFQVADTNNQEYAISLDSTEFGAMITNNAGMRLWTNNDSYWWGFWSSDYIGNTAYRPKLVVDYTEGGSALTIAEASHSHAADAISLAQNHDLTIAEASHSHTADGGLTLAQTHTLTIQDATHGHTVESTTFTSNLVIADASHSQAADGELTLTQVHTLVIHDAIHGHRADRIDAGTARPRRRRGLLIPI